MFVLIHLVVVDSIQSASATVSMIMYSVRAARNCDFAPYVFPMASSEHKSESISDATIQMDHNAVVLFTIDHLARSPRTTVRTRGTGEAPDR